MGWFEKLTQIKKVSGKTHEELSTLSGVPKSTIDKVFSSAIKNPPYATVEKLIHALGYSVDALSTPNWDSSSLTSQADNLTNEQREYVEKYFALNPEGRERVHATINFELAKQQGKRKTITEIAQPDNIINFPRETVTLLEPSLPVCAGTGNYLDDNIDYVERKVLKNKYTYGASYIIKLQGDSMEPEFHDGDRLIVTDARGHKPIYGRVGIFIINGTAFLRQPLGDILHPYSSKYDDIVPGETDDVRYVGYVVGIIDDSWIIE